MKRKLLYIDIALATLATALAVGAYVYTRGVDIYVMATKTGSFLVVAWQIAASVALALWIPVIVAAIRKLAGRKSVDTVSNVTEENGAPIKPKRGRKAPECKDGTLTKPRGPADAVDKTEIVDADKRGETAKLFGTIPNATAPTEHIGAVLDDSTELLKGPLGDSATEILKETENDGARTETPTVTEDGPAAATTSAERRGDMATTQGGPSGDDRKGTTPPKPFTHRSVYCSQCGTEVTGKKFCPKCGKKVEV